MKIAFDVMGTIDGPSQKKVLALYHEFERLGHEMVVWSSMYSLAVRAVKNHNLKANSMSKMERYQYEPSEYMDLAIDDENQTYLAANRLVLVRDIPDDIENFAMLLIENRIGEPTNGDI